MIFFFFFDDEESAPDWVVLSPGTTIWHEGENDQDYIIDDDYVDWDYVGNAITWTAVTADTTVWTEQ